MPGGPMTLIVEVVLIGCLVVGMVIIFRSLAGRRSSRESVCPRCHNHNPGHAKYCANCGDKLNSARTPKHEGI